MTLTNLINPTNGRSIVNAFVAIHEGNEVFMSYRTTIAIRDKDGSITLDTKAYAYSRTTSRHLGIFLGFGRKEAERQIECGEIIVADFNNGESK